MTVFSAVGISEPLSMSDWQAFVTMLEALLSWACVQGSCVQTAVGDVERCVSDRTHGEG